MKQTLLQLFILLTLVSCIKKKLPEEAAPRPDLRSNVQAASLAEVKVMTYNIHGGIGTDAIYNLQRIADTIRNSGADVIGLNEVDKNFQASTNYDDQVTWLANELGMYSAFQATTVQSAIPANGNKPRLFGHAILSRYPIQVLNARLYDEHDNHNFGLLETRIVVNGFPMLFYVTHLITDSIKQISQRQQLKGWMLENYGTKILMGDMNAYPPSSTIGSLKETMVDAFEGHPKSYTFKSSGPVSRIDYILGTSNITFSNSRVIADTVKTNPHPSDHFPIVTNVSVGASKLRLMQYNIRYGVGTDNVLNLQRIADTIRNSGAHVVILNAVDRNYDPRSNYVDQLAWLANELGMFYEFQKTTWKSPIPASGNNPREFGHAILSKYPIGNASTQERLYYTDYTTHYNGLLKVRISVNADPLYVYITNLGITSADRLSQAQEAMSVIDPRNYTWKVFAGTFNDDPGTPPINTVLTSFTDVFSGQAAYTYPADVPTSRVDYIFLKNTIAFSNRRVIGSLGSTHRPIVCDIEMTQ
jgi:endonuclease/exonuclease/phosphatase family metal-dependent hydrolase